MTSVSSKPIALDPAAKYQRSDALRAQGAAAAPPAWPPREKKPCATAEPPNALTEGVPPAGTPATRRRRGWRVRSVCAGSRRTGMGSEEAVEIARRPPSVTSGVAGGQ